MSKTPRRISNAASGLVDAVIAVAGMMLAYLLRFEVFDGIRNVGSMLEYAAWAAAFSLVFVFLYSLAGVYDRRPTGSTTRTMGRVILCNTLAIMLYVDYVFLIRMVDFSRWLIVFAWVLINVMSCVKVSLIARRERLLCQQGPGRRRVIVVGSGSTAQAYARAVHQQYPAVHELLGSVGLQPIGERTRYLGPYEDLDFLLESLLPEEVVVAPDASEYGRISEILLRCENSGVRVMLLPTYHDLISSRPIFSQETGLPLVAMNRIPLDNMGYAFVKRAFDVVGSLALIVLTSPVMLVAIVGTLLSSPGPVIFRQERIGRNRKPFYIYKFRSMRVNADSDKAWTTGGDPRRTRFGSFMRRYSIDELPQLFNVLQGDMSLVGPRPEIPNYVEHFKHNVPLYMVRHQVRPGMTGWAQVNGLRGDTSIEQRVEYDLYYLENWSIMFDLRILLMTPAHGVVNKQEILI